MKEYNIDGRYLAEYRTDHCKQAEPTTEWGSPTKGIGEIIGKF
jgi:hypothetical protein